ncbi:hypothetical protein BH10BAC5_BH10BAC5_25460 [soil metagenome]
MMCPSCKSSNAPESKFCIVCGAVIQSSQPNKKVCPNGHMYDSSLPSCPYCPSPSLQSKMGKFDNSTETFAGKHDSTRIMAPTSSPAGNKFGKTIIIDLDDIPGKSSNTRKLIGWLVTFSWKEEGQDFRIFEGRNLISGDSKSDVSLSDASISSPHCMILYRNGKIRIKDELSTNGTKVNDVEIEESELNDGDTIKIGRTELKFRTI